MRTRSSRQYKIVDDLAAQRAKAGIVTIKVGALVRTIAPLRKRT